eukprot:4483374-Karenia_brevis.AAC.1
MKEVPTFKMKLPEDYTEDEEETSKYLYGVLLMLTAGEAKGIVQANPNDGIRAWMKMHDRWNRKSGMGYTVVAEKI